MTTPKPPKAFHVHDVRDIAYSFRSMQAGRNSQWCILLFGRDPCICVVYPEAARVH